MTKRRRIVIPVLLVLAAIVAALLLLSKYGLAVTRLSLEFDDLPRGFDGFRIVQLSDLHGSEFGRDNARLIEAVAEEEPDIIALTGDFLDEGKAGQELPALEALVKELVKLAPVYFVSGNHDWASGAAPELFETLGAAGTSSSSAAWTTRTARPTWRRRTSSSRGCAARRPAPSRCCWRTEPTGRSALRTSTWTSSSAATPTAA